MLDSVFSSVLSVTDSTAASLSGSSFLLCSICSLVLGVVIAYIYMFKHDYSKNFVVTLALLPIIVQMVIALVNGNLGAGIAVMGVFNLVRFRSIPGSAKDIGAVFLAMAVGLATGMQIIVATDDTSKVQLVLNGIDITGSNGPCIHVQSADKVFITLADGATNTLSDSNAWALTDTEDEPNATIYSKSDLTLNGNGSLTINATVNHAVSSKDDLIITDGVYTIKAAHDGLRGKDCVKIAGGTFDITAAGDGIKSTNDTDDGRGFASIDGGTISIDAGDDGIHGEYNMNVASGTIAINTCYEGIEGQAILVSGGDIIVYSQDDGLNAAEGGTSSSSDISGMGDGAPNSMNMGGGMSDHDATQSSTTSPTATTQNTADTAQQNGMDPTGGDMNSSSNASLEISGGRLVIINTQDGDGIDSNGSLTISGGTVLISGAYANDNSALDSGIGSNSATDSFGFATSGNVSDGTSTPETASTSWQDSGMGGMQDGQAGSMGGNGTMGNPGGPQNGTTEPTDMR